MPFCIKALGSPLIEVNDGAGGGLAVQRRTLALLVLIAAAERGISRDKLIGLLWPDTTDERARHAFAQTLYRLRQQFGADAVDGTEILRIRPGIFEYDVQQFENAARDAGSLQRAVELYRGPFFDGFFLPDAPDFERWIESERGRLATLYRSVLERLAHDATRAQLPERSVHWWRMLANSDPLNSRVAAQLVRALVGAGDGDGALSFARLHEQLVRQELDREPSPEFAAAVDSVRRVPSSEVRVPLSSSAPSPSVGATEAEAPPLPSWFGSTAETVRLAIPRRSLRRTAVTAAIVLTAAGGIAIASFAASGTAAGPTIALGYIADYTGRDTSGAARILPELLTTNLSRVEGLTILPRARLQQDIAGPADSARASDFARAAEGADVDALIDGALYRRDNGMLRLDLRVLELRSGRILGVRQVEANEVFALADSATKDLAGELGARLTGTLRVSDVTTNSPEAFRVYEEGLRALTAADHSAAQRLFEAALKADSTFAMAAFGAYHAYQPVNGQRATEFLDRARRLATRATERERLIINATWEHWQQTPAMVAAAESVAHRFPADAEGQLLLANALTWSGDFAGALVPARQAMALDSANRRPRRARCVACEAHALAALSYAMMDSLDAADRIARDWIARDDSAAHAWRIVRDVALSRDDLAEAARAHQRAQALSTPNRWEDYFLAVNVALRAGDHASITAYGSSALASGTPGDKSIVWWWQVISERQAGRLNDALRTSQQLRRLSPREANYMQLQAQILREMDEPLRALAILDSVVAIRRDVQSPSQRARHVAWAFTQLASALAAAGRVADLPRIADSIEFHGRQSGYGRDPRLHHHARGLWHAAHGRHVEAIREFRLAMWSPLAGYTRTNIELGRLLIEGGRPHEAIPILRAAVRAGFESVALYVTKTEARAWLARAHAAAGNTDSALMHREWVRRVLADADAPVRRRLLDIPR